MDTYHHVYNTIPLVGRRRPFLHLVWSADEWELECYPLVRAVRYAAALAFAAIIIPPAYFSFLCFAALLGYMP